jgi:glutathione S-transferase
MYTLYYSPGTASMAVHLTLIEIGAPYELQRLDFAKDEQRSADYLKLNPRGQVPTLVIDGRPYFEAAALVMILAERHPEAKLAPPPGSPMRADWYQWIVFFANSLAPAYRQWFYPPDLGSAEHPPAVREALRTTIEEAWSFVDTHLAARGPYMLGPDFSAVDLLALMYMRWSRNMPKPVTAWPALRAYADRLRARPSWARMYEVEGLTDWRA